MEWGGVVGCEVAEFVGCGQRVGSGEFGVVEGVGIVGPCLLLGWALDAYITPSPTLCHTPHFSAFHLTPPRRFSTMLARPCCTTPLSTMR